MSKTLFFIIAFVLITLIYSYTTTRLWQMIPRGSAARVIMLSVVIAAYLSFFLSMLLSNIIPVTLGSSLYKFGSSYFFIALYLLFIFLLLDLLRATNLLPLDKFMRDSWSGTVILATLLIVVFVAGNLNYRKKLRSEVTIELSKPMQRENKSLKAVFISDLHLGYMIGANEFKEWIELINREQADIVLIGGDIIDNSTRPLYAERMEQLFKTIKAKHGVYASLGNHEYMMGVNQSLEFLERAGVNVLRDSATLVDNLFYVVGRDDNTNGRRKSLDELLSTLDKTKPIILLDHQPRELPKAEQAGVDIQLSGHTHRGQIFPITIIADRMFDLSHGYRQSGNSHFYVSTGIGIWGGKFRIGSRSEYVVLNIK